MAANLTVNANKRIRGKILMLLYSVAPGLVEVRTITNSLLDAGSISVPDLARHVDYLAGKGYVTVIDEEDAEKLLRGQVPVDAFLKLTPTGIDLVEGTIEDLGVDV